MEDRYHVINIHDYVDTEEYFNIKLETDNLEYFWVSLNGKELIFETDLIKFHDNIDDGFIVLPNDVYRKDFILLVERVILRLTEFIKVPYKRANIIYGSDSSILVVLNERRIKLLADNHDKIEGLQFSFKFDIQKDYTILKDTGEPVYILMLYMPHLKLTFSEN
jgi:hypothetical protein